MFKNINSKFTTSVAAAIVCSITVGSASAQPAPAGKFPPSNIAGVSVTGLTNEEALRRTRRELDRKLDTQIALTDGFRSLRRKRRDIGIELELGWMLGRARAGQKYVPLRLRANVLNAQRALRRLAPNFAAPARNARIGEVDGKVRITPHQPARTMHPGRSAVRLARDIDKNAALRTLTLSVDTKAPPITTDRFKGITGVLGRFTTRYDAGNVKRTTNMRVAIRAIDGHFLQPGKVFSLNGTVGERTQARGYRTSIIFKNGYKVPGLGAGVSQVTGTLFNAALMAGLPIVAYRTHSQPVTYLPIGRDATVSYGDFDMKFKNNTAVPIYISYKITGSRVTARLFGKPVAGRQVSVLVRRQNKAERHITAQLYRTIKQNGKVAVKERVGRSEYKWNAQNWE